MDVVMRDEILKVYILGFSERFQKIVNDVVPELSKIKTSQVHGLMDLVTNPDYGTVDKVKTELGKRHDRYWKEECPNLYRKLKAGIDSLSVLAKDIVESHVNNQGQALGITIDRDFVHMTLVRKYFYSAVQLHLGRET
jgi:hypothetical protein